MRSSSIWKKGRLSTIWKTIEVVFHIYSIWFQISLHAKNQLTLLPTTALIVMGPSVVVVCVVFLPIIILPHKTQIILQVDQSAGWYLNKVKVNVESKWDSRYNVCTFQFALSANYANIYCVHVKKHWQEFHYTF